MSVSPGKRRALLLLHSLSRTGAPKVILDAFEALQNDISLYTVSGFDGPLAGRCRALGPLQIVDTNSRLEKARRALRGEYDLFWERELRRFRPEVIYVNSVAALPLLDSALLPEDVPVILHVHELESYVYHFARNCPERFLQKPSRYIACSEAVRDCLIGVGIAANRVTVIHEFVRQRDFEDYAPSAEPSLVEDAARPLIVAGAGSQELRKGATLWLQTAAECVRRRGLENIRFLWVGVDNSPAGWQFRDFARRLGLEDVVEFVPMTDAPLAHIARADVFAMTSWEDPCPIVVLESMMMEKPVLCFAGSGGAPEEVGPTGIVVEDFSPVRMADEIEKLAHDPARRRELGAAARQRIGERFTDTILTPYILQEVQSLAR